MLKNYSLLKGVIVQDLEDSIKRGNAHHTFIVLSENLPYQINVDIQSASSPNIKVFFEENFNNPLLPYLDELPKDCLTDLAALGDNYRLDYIRDKILSREEVENAFPQSAADISALLDLHIQEGVEIYALGEFYNNKQNREKMPYGLELRETQAPHLPPQGLHDIHMNQGVPSQLSQFQDNGIYQDGALFLKTPGQKIKAFFFIFDEQCFTTNAAGNCVAEE